MRLPRARITLRLMMIGVAALAMPLAAMMGPYPTMIIGDGPFTTVVWSDGFWTIAAGDDLHVAGVRVYGRLMRVDWSDRSWSLHIMRPAPVPLTRTGGAPSGQAGRL